MKHGHPRALAGTSLALFSLFAFFVIITAGCASSDPNERADIVVPIAPAMALDPTQEVELPRWFTNSDITIEFDPAGSYRVYEGLNRHAAPMERGRWVRVNYASVSLEPYATGRAAAPVRGALFMENETLMLRLPRAVPLRALAGPPVTVEDELMGAWTGGNASLELLRDMRFVYRHDMNADASAVANITGTWRVQDDTLILLPAVGAARPMTFVMNRHGETLSLEAEGQALTAQ